MNGRNALSEHLEHRLKQQAFGQAVKTIADHAEMLAQEMDAGRVADRGGAEALRLVVAIVRFIDADNPASGHIH